MVTWCHVLLGWAPGRRPGGLSAVTRPGLGLLTYYELGTFLGACGDMGHPERVTKDAGTPLPLKPVLPEEGTLILEENPYLRVSTDPEDSLATHLLETKRVPFTGEY